MSATLTLWPAPYVARCANQDCLAIFASPGYEMPLGSFCPACRVYIKDKLEAPDAIFDDAEDDGKGH